MSDLIYRLRKRAEIRRQIPGRRSVEEGKPDRIAELLEEAAQALEKREWVGLTDEQVADLVEYEDWHNYPANFAKTVEAICKRNNT